jgi:HEAT repeat protein
LQVARDETGPLSYLSIVAVMFWLKQRQLSSKDAAVRRKAMQQICDSPTPRALDALRNALDDDDAEVRRLAVVALSRLEDERRLDPLLVALRDRHPEVLKTAISALRRFNRERVLNALAPLIFNPDAGVRGHAAQVLDTMGWEPSNRDEEIWYAVSKSQLTRAAAFGIAALPALESVLLGGPYNLRVAAVEAISAIDDKRAARPLMAALRSPDAAVAGAAVEALSNTGDAQVIPAIIGVLRSADTHARVVAAEALGRMNAAEAAESLRLLLRDPAWDVRRSAAEALGRLKDATCVEALARNLKDSDQDVREATALALGNVGDRRAIGPLVKALTDSAAGVRRIASAALMRIDDDWSHSAEAQTAVEELKSGLLDKDPDMRHLVGKVLASLGQTTTPEVAAATPAEDKLYVSSPEKTKKLAVSLFVLILSDEDRDLRQAAAECLGRLGDERSQAALLRAMGDGDTGVRFAAERALETLKFARSAS